MYSYFSDNYISNLISLDFVLVCRAKKYYPNYDPRSLVLDNLL